MPSSSSALEAVVHYKKKLTRHLEDNDPDVMLHCLSKLDRVPMTFDILQETEVGRTVNGLKRRTDLDPEVADLAKTIVRKWKDIVANHEEQEEAAAAAAAAAEQAATACEPVIPPAAEEPPPSEEEEVEQHPLAPPSPPPPPTSSSKPDEHHKKHKKSSSKDKSSRDSDSHHRSSSSIHKSSSHKSSSHESSSSSSHKKHKKDKKDHRRERDDEGHKRSSSHSSSSSSYKNKLSAFGAALSGGGGSNGEAGHHKSKSPAGQISTSNGNSSSTSRMAASSLVEPVVPKDLNPNYRPGPQLLPQLPPAATGAADNSRHVLNGRMRTEEEELSVLMSKKGTRGQMYSGVKRSAFKDVPSLQDLCIHLLREKVDHIEQCGGLPYELLRPILVRASPSTLMNIEECNQYLMEDTGALWEKHCRKDFPRSTREELESYREMYERCKVERAEKLEQLTAKMTNSYKKIKDETRKTKVAFVGGIVKPPKSVVKRQERTINGGEASASVNARPSNALPGGTKRGRPPLPIGGGGGGGGGGSSNKKPKVAPMMAKTLKLARSLKGGNRR